MLVAGHYKFQDMLLMIPDILHELQHNALSSPGMFVSVFVEDAASSEVHLCAQQTNYSFLKSCVLILIWPSSSKMGRGPHKANIALDFLKSSCS